MTSDTPSPFTGPDLSDTRYEKATMARAAFDGVDLSGARFFAVMTDAVFTDTNLANARFDDVNLSTSRFENVNLGDAVFDDVNLAGATFSNLNLSNVTIERAALDGLRIDGELVSDLFAALERERARDRAS